VTKAPTNGLIDSKKDENASPFTAFLEERVRLRIEMSDWNEPVQSHLQLHKPG
jgi:hypothetical protein